MFFIHLFLNLIKYSYTFNLSKWVYFFRLFKLSLIYRLLSIIYIYYCNNQFNVNLHNINVSFDQFITSCRMNFYFVFTCWWRASSSPLLPEQSRRRRFVSQNRCHCRRGPIKVTRSQKHMVPSFCVCLLQGFSRVIARNYFIM